MSDFTVKLADCLHVLSLSSREQIRYLKDIGGVSVDELALQYEDVAVLAAEKFGSGEISEDLFNLIGSLDEKINSMSGSDREDLWTEEALASSDDWKKVREIAETCLGKVARQPPKA